MNRHFLILTLFWVIIGCQNSPSERIPNKKEIHASIERGVEFLLENQNKDGSWGSSQFDGGVFLYATVPGGHRSFKAAVTSLSVLSLIEVANKNNPKVKASIDKAEKWMLVNLPKVRRGINPSSWGNGVASDHYSVWGHSYGIQGLVGLIKYRNQEGQQESALFKAIQNQVRALEKTESVHRGWGYYDQSMSKKPNSGSTPFTTATAMVALKQAQMVGVDIPLQLQKRGVKLIKKLQNPDFTYMYSNDHIRAPVGAINRLGGSLGRSQVCNYALRLWGDKEITDELTTTWLKHLVEQNGWLEMGRKKPRPHESFLAVAAYFYYYGHYYAALGMDKLPSETRQHYSKELARLIAYKQENNGSWWDFPMYNYHRFYGTPMALMILHRCRLNYPDVK